jgi:MoaA/NifB/PqqE/SkfB family radical SAM enzyme
MRIRLENTNICYEQCKFCPHPQMKRHQGYMDMKLFERLVLQIKEWGVPEIVIQGFGEPLLDPDILKRIEFCRFIGIPKIQTNVNAKYLSPKLTIELLNSGLHELFISCNKEGEGNIRYLSRIKRKQYPKVYLSFIKGETEPYDNHLNVDGISISYPHNWGGYYPSKPGVKDPCRLCWVTMYISWDGFAHLCCMDYDVNYKYGDAKERDLKLLWKWHPYRQIHKENLFNTIPICKDCDHNRHSKSPWWI